MSGLARTAIGTRSVAAIAAPALRTVRVGLLGFGTVGASTTGLLWEHSSLLSARSGARFVPVAALVRDPGKPRLVAVPPGFTTTDPDHILDDPSIDVVVEAIGGTDPALAYVHRALRSGKHVVTSNKALVADHGPALAAEARRLGRRFLFEASVGGGIPLIGPLLTSLAGNRVTRLRGVLNGTCNFILDAMADQGWTYEDALAEAQARGYAEADPSDDVSGRDTARKIAILAGLAGLAGRDPVDYRRAEVVGIAGISAGDVTRAVTAGYRPKLVAEAVFGDTGQVQLRVRPALLEPGDPLAALRGPENGIWVEAYPVGSVFFRGPGAGGPATASAVVGDLLGTLAG